MRIVFAGTPEFAAVSLRALLKARHDVTLVLSQPDRPAGRGLKLRPSAVKALALESGLAILQPDAVNAPAVRDAIAAARPEVMVVAAYGRILPRVLLELPPRGCVNVHASLLPRWRGAAPIQHALLAGDARTGVTIMQMDEGLDTGPMLLQRSVSISATDTSATLHDRLAELGAELLLEALSTWPAPVQQDASAVTVAPRITPKQAQIDWSRSAEEIDRQIRAFNPVPGAQSALDGTPIKIWRATVERGAFGAAGTVSEAGSGGIVIACGRDALRILELQRAGGKRLPVPAFLMGHRLDRGARFGRADG